MIFKEKWFIVGVICLTCMLLIAGAISVQESTVRAAEQLQLGATGDQERGDFQTMGDEAVLIVQSLTVEPVTSVLGTELTATVVIKNQGSTNVFDGFDVDFYEDLSDPPEPLQEGDDYQLVPWIYAGEEVVLVFNFTPLSAGEKNAWVQLDTFLEVMDTSYVYGPVSYSVEDSAVMYTLEVDKIGEGTVEVDGTTVGLPYSEDYEEDAVVSLKAVPAAGWAFQNWVINGVDDFDALISVTLDAHKSATAIFQATGTGSINHVVLEIGENMVIFTIGAYGSALAAGPGNELYDYMATGGVPVVRAVGSGDKFIGIGAYGTAFAQEGNTADAIGAAPAQDQATISGYLIFEGFDAGEPILTPLFP